LLLVATACAADGDEEAISFGGKFDDIGVGDAVEVEVPPGETVEMILEVPMRHGVLRLSGTGVADTTLEVELLGETWPVKAFPGTPAPRLSFSLADRHFLGERAPLVVHIKNPTDSTITGELELAEHDPGVCAVGDNPNAQWGQHLLICDELVDEGPQTKYVVGEFRGACLYSSWNTFFAMDVDFHEYVDGYVSEDVSRNGHTQVFAASRWDSSGPREGAWFDFSDEAPYFHTEHNIDRHESTTGYRTPLRYDTAGGTLDVFRQEDHGRIGADWQTQWDLTLRCRPVY
jgi:hypothetical protein